MLNNELREEAEKRFVFDGQELKKISGEIGVKVNTLFHWQQKYDWSDKRKNFKQRTNEALYYKLTAQIEQSVQRFLAFSLLVSQCAMEAGQYFLTLTLEQRNKEINLISKWITLTERASKIHRNVVPDANEQLSQKILDELKELNSRMKE